MNAERTEPELSLGDRHPRVMAQSVVYDEEGSPDLARKTAFAMAVAANAFLGWAAFVSVDETIAIPGEVVVSGEVQTIRHQDGGTVVEAMVKDGEIVEKGQILMRLASRDLNNKLQSVKIRRVGVGLLVAELKVLGSGKEPEFAFALPEHKDMVQKEKVVFESLKDLTEKRRRDIDLNIAKLKNDLVEIDKRHQALSKNTDILEEELQFREELFKKGLTDKGVFEETKAQVEKAYKELADLTAEKQKTTKALADIEVRMRAFHTRLRSRVLDELNSANQVLDNLSASVENLEGRVAGLTIAAPATGVAKSAGGVPAVGATIPPAVPILDIVPVAGIAAVEARIDPADLSRAAVGNRVAMKISSGVFTGLTGRLTEIAETTTTDETGKAYHRAVITLDGGPLARAKPRDLPAPGTAIVASLQIGSQPLYAHLWQKMAGGLGAPAGR